MKPIWSLLQFLTVQMYLRVMLEFDIIDLLTMA